MIKEGFSKTVSILSYIRRKNMKFRTMFMLSLFVTFFAWLAPVVAHSATYYVAKSGTNSYSCAQAQSAYMPKLTITGGLACLKGGDTLVIHAGTYAEFIDRADIPNGTASAWTAVKAETAGTVILRPTRGGSAGDVVYLSGQSYITLDGLVIDAANAGVQGIRINEYRSIPTTHITLKNLEVKNAPNNCIGVQGNPVPSDVQVINVKAHHCGRDRFHHGIYIFGSNNFVEHSEFYNNSGHGIHLFHSTNGSNNNNLFRFNLLYNNGSSGILIGSGKNNVAHDNTVRNNGTQTGEGGISIGYRNPHNNEVYNNIIHSNRGDCIRVSSDSVNSKVYNNTCWQNQFDKVRNQGSGSAMTNNLVTNPATIVATPPSATIPPSPVDLKVAY
jgi:hypothetical protein